MAALAATAQLRDGAVVGPVGCLRYDEPLQVVSGFPRSATVPIVGGAHSTILLSRHELHFIAQMCLLMLILRYSL
jgi:hypothetical protein